jgi:hypothetical protein
MNHTVIIVNLPILVIDAFMGQASVELQPVPCGDFAKYDSLRNRINLAIPLNISIGEL